MGYLDLIQRQYKKTKCDCDKPGQHICNAMLSRNGKCSRQIDETKILVNPSCYMIGHKVLFKTDESRSI